MILRTDAWSWKTAAPSERHDMKILLVGGGGREHAIACAISKSPKCTKLYCAPGNAGIAAIAECVPIGVMEYDKLVAFAKEKEIAAAADPKLANKPPQMLEKILAGKINRFFSEVCLVNQPWVRDDKTTLAKLHPEVKIKRFARWAIGEEI